MDSELTPLRAISPVDGRYRRATEPLADYFSESALIRYRLMVEIEYFIGLCRLPLPQLSAFESSRIPEIRRIFENFSGEDARRVKEIEKITNHDVKAVEYFLKEQFDALGLASFKEFIHFGLTSQDINNTAMPFALKTAWLKIIQPALAERIEQLGDLARRWRAIPMLARTHGQPASPTTVGKEIQVYVGRLRSQLDLVKTIPFAAKFGGATGNFNAHHVAYPQFDWPAFGNRLVNETLGLSRTPVTTQIEPYDHLAAFCDNVKRINTIWIDFCRDIWSYIAMDYFKQEIKSGEVGSSAMPHKINPIDFENAEGNLGVANAVLEHLAAKLPISRLQRDLTDSTVIRNIGVPLAHTLVALKSIRRGLGKLLLNEEEIRRDLRQNWAVIAEAVQTILRREGYPAPFEALKALTRNHTRIDRDAFTAFIEKLDVSEAVKKELLAIKPENYTGVSCFETEPGDR
ncbi:MAG TPA: adenylosuccinate lyase [Desulfobacterales bacterium]